MKVIPQPLIELLQRFFKSNPKFFKIIQYISAAVFVLSWVAGLLIESGVYIPEIIDTVLNNAAAKIGAITAIIMAQLPNQDINNGSNQ